jgi:glycosyltransferase involved in cell wall biosynthesis
MPLTPAVSIIIPIYNAGKFLASTLDSVLAQTFSDWEGILIDDGSSDNSLAVAQSYAARFPNIRTLSQPNGGNARARNQGFAASNPNAPYVVFVDADDLWAPDALRSLYDTLLSHPDAPGAHGLADNIDSVGNPLHPGEFLSYGRNRIGLLNGQPAPWPLDQPTTFSVVAYEDRMFPAGAVIYRRSALLAAGLYDESLRHYEDVDLHLRITASGSLPFLNQQLASYRRHSSNWSSHNKDGAKAYWAVRKKLARSPLLSPEQRQILARTSLLFQQRKTAMWLSAGNHDLKHGEFKRAINCYAHLLVNNFRTLRLHLTSGQA